MTNGGRGHNRGADMEMTYAELMHLYTAEGLSLTEAHQAIMGLCELFIRRRTRRHNPTIRALGGRTLIERPSVLDVQIIMPRDAAIA